MKRRLSLLLGVTALSVVAAPQPPNILLIFCDDLTRQAISAYRHPLHLLQTPNLDRLAREGMLFERCLVPNSICGPSRAVVLTGKYSHLNGFYRNGNRFDSAQQTFPKLLQAAGYQTAIIGKWHLDSDPTGFDYWQILPGQGIYYNPAFIKHGKRETHEGYVTDLITDFSLEWLRHRDRSKPFLLLSQHKATHREWSPPLRHLGWHKDRQFAEPETLFDDYANRGRAEHEQDMTLAKTFTRLDAKLDTPRSLNAAQRKVWDAYYAPRNQEFIQANLTGKDLVRWRYQRYMHDYLGVALAVDDSVGRLLKYLDDEGLADNTLVVFSSDQGFFLGEHGWFDKRWIYEESLTTPLIIRWPGVGPIRQSERIWSRCSIFRKRSWKLRGCPCRPTCRGAASRPAARRDAQGLAHQFLLPLLRIPGLAQCAQALRRRDRAVPLFYFYEPEMNYWTLIDNDADPHELKNVYNDPRYANTQRQLHAELTRLRTELKVRRAGRPGIHFALRASARECGASQAGGAAGAG